MATKFEPIIVSFSSTFTPSRKLNPLCPGGSLLAQAVGENDNELTFDHSYRPFRPVECICGKLGHALTFLCVLITEGAGHRVGRVLSVSPVVGILETPPQ